jgi:hypothetical protein
VRKKPPPRAQAGLRGRRPARGLDRVRKNAPAGAEAQFFGVAGAARLKSGPPEEKARREGKAEYTRPD